MGPPGHVTDVGDGPSGACFWFWDLWTGGFFFFVLGTYGGWVATLENPFGTLEALETLGTLCVALCGDKVRTNFPTCPSVGMPRDASASSADVYGAAIITDAGSCLCSCSIVAAICMVRDDMRDARIVM